MSEEKEVSRRDFLGVSILVMGGLIGLGFLVPAIAYIIGPALGRKESQEWIRLGSTSKVEVGTPTLFKVKIEQQTGWIVNEEELSVYVFTEDGREYIAMSNVCTHLGCRVRWISDENKFFCPCHNAIFDERGFVVSGPPPRPLYRYEVKVEEDQLFIKEI